MVKNLITFETMTGQPRSLVAVKIIDGRTHQIRVSVAARKSKRERGTPIVDDPLYNPGTPNPEGRMRLHAYKMEIAHPEAGTRLELTAPVPADFYDELDDSTRSKLKKIAEDFSIRDI